MEYQQKRKILKGTLVAIAAFIIFIVWGLHFLSSHIKIVIINDLEKDFSLIIWSPTYITEEDAFKKQVNAGEKVTLYYPAKIFNDGVWVCDDRKYCKYLEPRCGGFMGCGHFRSLRTTLSHLTPKKKDY